MPNEIGPEHEGELVGNYRIYKTIGQGSYGKVKLAMNLKTKEKVAVKIINKQNIKNVKQATRIKREIRFLKLLHHPHIVKVWDVLETQEHIYIIMEFARGGELFEYIVSHKRLKDKEARHFFRQIISAVDYCHKNSVIHRDLKPENLLLDENKNIKIIDFGFSNTFKSHQFLETFCGSPFYAAPEMVLGQRYEGPEVDMWSLGIILFTLLCGHLPFDDPNPKELYRKILSGVFIIPDYLSPEAKDLIGRMICVDPKARAKIEEVKQHRWMNLGYDSIVSSYFPIRQVLATSQLNQEILQRLRSFGYAEVDIEAAFHDPTLNNPIVNTYYLIAEMISREESKMKSNQISRGNSKLSLSNAQLYSIKENSQIGYEHSTPMEISSTSQLPSVSIKHYRKASLNEEAAKMIPQHLQQPVNASPPSFAPPNQLAPFKSAILDKKDKHKRRFSLPILDAIMSNKSQSQELDCQSEPLRIMNGWFFSVSTTSSMDPQSILQELTKGLAQNGIIFHRESAYIIRCFWPGPTPSKVDFEIEICRVPRLNLNGLNFKRLQGSFWSYKKICNKLISQMNLGFKMVSKPDFSVLAKLELSSQKLYKNISELTLNLQSQLRQNCQVTHDSMEVFHDCSLETCKNMEEYSENLMKLVDKLETLNSEMEGLKETECKMLKFF